MVRVFRRVGWEFCADVDEEFWVLGFFFLREQPPGLVFLGAGRKGETTHCSQRERRRRHSLLGRSCWEIFNGVFRACVGWRHQSPRQRKKAKPANVAISDPANSPTRPDTALSSVFCLFARVDQDSSWRIGRKGVKPFLFKSRAFHSSHSRSMHLLGLVALLRPPIHPFACFPLEQSLACICCVSL